VNSLLLRIYIGTHTCTIFSMGLAVVVWTILRCVRAFSHLTQLLRDNGLLRDSIYVPIEEQLAMFLHILGHKSKNRVMRGDFIRFNETKCKYFNKVKVQCDTIG